MDKEISSEDLMLPEQLQRDLFFHVDKIKKLANDKSEEAKLIALLMINIFGDIAERDKMLHGEVLCCAHAICFGLISNVADNIEYDQDIEYDDKIMRIAEILKFNPQAFDKLQMLIANRIMKIEKMHSKEAANG
jgi:hypothetical protein